MKRMTIKKKILQAAAKPPTNEAMIAADLGATRHYVERVVTWGIRMGYLERVPIEGYLPHLALTAAGRALLVGAA
jgi:DNA-binding MarR family transcriptional regulator